MSLMFDPATLTKAIDEFMTATSSNTLTVTGTPAHAFQAWFVEYRQRVTALKSLHGMASYSHVELNAYLKQHGFDPMFQPFAGVGAVGIYKLDSPWAGEAQGRTMRLGARHVKAFEVKTEVSYFDIDDHLHRNEKLVRIATQDGGAIWVIMPPAQPTSTIILADMAAYLMHKKVPSRQRPMPLLMPSVDLTQRVSLDWLIGTNIGGYSIDQAFQVLSVNLSEEGARIKAASGIATKGGSPRFVIDRPFAAWRTEPNSEVPIATLFADEGDWLAA